MSKVHRLRALVSERLTAAAEEIFALVERTLAEYEEELCRSKEENQRKQQLLAGFGDSQSGGHGGDAQSSHRFINNVSQKQDVPEPPLIKEEPEEHRLKQEEEQLPEFTAVCVKSEDQSSKGQSSHRNLTQGEHCAGADPHLHSQTEQQTDNSSDTDNDEDWEPPARFSLAQMETEADGEHYNQVQINDTSTATHNSSPLNKAEEQLSASFQCQFCQKRFTTPQNLELHTKVHTGVKLYKCPICLCVFRQKSSFTAHAQIHREGNLYRCCVCGRTFAQLSSLTQHNRTHTGEKPYSCSVCNNRFTQHHHLTEHMRIHTGERPYGCSVCGKKFARSFTLKMHKRQHKTKDVESLSSKSKIEAGAETGTTDKLESGHEAGLGSGFRPGCDVTVKTKPFPQRAGKLYCCSLCNRTFTQLSSLTSHNRTHTGEKPYSCSVCNNRFTQQHHLTEHMRIHTGERPYGCSVCGKKFARSFTLKIHMKTHRAAPSSSSAQDYSPNTNVCVKVEPQSDSCQEQL
ncbi:hypothetical protein WMY93_024746 [Mugilogobius chulae]|uniref:C2H2-type domain-containing protein n=1 Tax=Mugilogobius chulae TaxID=88201 RepID=A0AAW0N799_9GOBI